MPLVVALIPSALQALGAGWKFTADMACILVPLAAALVRCEVGVRQLKARVRNPPPVARQILLAAAIVVLALFEVAANIARMCDVPVEVWYTAGGLYAVYLVFIWGALRPSRLKLSSDLVRGLLRFSVPLIAPTAGAPLGHRASTSAASRLAKLCPSHRPLRSWLDSAIDDAYRCQAILARCSVFHFAFFICILR
jgi:hypothetical protein